ncbi:MAG TPA: S9 family peptidase [Firmicutes bacterium]|nr:S9 family peptidase [Bacillota bacterium]
MQKVTMEDLGKIYTLSEVSYSPDGTAAAFVVSQAQVKENKYTSSIWVLENGVPRKLTSGGAESSYLWLDEESLLFPGDRKKSHKPEPGQACTVYNRIDIHGGEAEELFTIPMKVKSIRKISSHEFLIIGLYQHNAIEVTGLEGKEREDAIERLEEEKDYEVFDELPFWANGKGVVNKQRSRLYLYDSDNGECRLLSPEFMNVSSFDYDRENDRVLYYGHDYQWMDDQKDDMFVCGVHSGKSVEIGLQHRYGVSGAAFLGDKVVFAASTREKYGSSENPVFFLADPRTGEVTELADLDPSMYSSVGSDCRYGGGRSHKATESGWYYTETRGFNSYIVRLDRAGKETVVSPQIDGSVDCFDYFEGNFLYVGMRENGLQELYTCREGEGKEEKLTGFNEEYLNTHKVAPLHPLNFVDKDGVEIDGWVIEPVDYDPQKTYPGILDVHGGPKTVYGVPFFHEMQLWASEGYFVFFCNPRGGDGKGNEFADIRGKRYGVLDYNDLMEFTDKVLEKYPQIDRAHIGMTGGSYGGFMANWIIGHTDRFAAVASQRSISNFISKCLTTDIGYYHNLSAVQADPWKNPEDMWERSPLKYADKCKTPTLFVQSDEDYRCWMGDAIQMFTALRMHGVPTRLCLFHGENHELSRSGKPKHRIRRLREITNWFDQYLKG